MSGPAVKSVKSVIRHYALRARVFCHCESSLFRIKKPCNEKPPTIPTGSGAHPSSTPALNLPALRVACSCVCLLLTSLRTFPIMNHSGKDIGASYETNQWVTGRATHSASTRKWERFSTIAQGVQEFGRAIPGVAVRPGSAFPDGGCWPCRKASSPRQGVATVDVQAWSEGLGGCGLAVGCRGHARRAAARHQAQERRSIHASITRAGAACFARVAAAISRLAVCIPQRTERTHDGIERPQDGHSRRSACQAAIPCTPAHAQTQPRLQTGQCRPGHARHSTLPRPQVNHTHSPLYRAVTRALQELFPRLTAVASLAGAAS